MTELTYKEQFQQYFDQATRLERGSTAQVNFLEKAIQLADFHRDKDLQIKVRKQYVESATWASYPEKAMTAYSFLLKNYDEKPDSYGNWEYIELLWMYKWTINHLYEFPSVSLEKIEAALADMDRRYQASNMGKKASLQYHFMIYGSIGNFEKADHFFELYEKESGGMLMDCTACSISREVAYFRRKGDFKKAIELAQPILDGKHRCDNVPKLFYHTLFVPFILSGQLDSAIHYHKQVKPENDMRFLSLNSETINLFAVQNKFTEAIKIFEKNLHFALGSLAKEHPFDFYLASRLLFRKLEKAGHDSIKLNLEESTPFFKKDHEYQIRDLIDWFDRQIAQLEAAFNQRNKNNYFSTYVEKSLRLEEIN